MLQLTPHHSIHVAIEPIDFRKGINGLVAICQQHLSQEPFSGHIFVFRNRLKTAVKLLVYDGNGFWLCHKRFSSGKLAWWPDSKSSNITIPAMQLQVMLQQGNPMQAELPSPWLPLQTT